MGVKDSSGTFISAILEVRVMDENETKVNFKPKDLRTLEQLSVYENEPLGTYVGEFNATDPEERNPILFSYIRCGR